MVGVTGSIPVAPTTQFSLPGQISTWEKNPAKFAAFGPKFGFDIRLRIGKTCLN